MQKSAICEHQTASIANKPLPSQLCTSDGSEVDHVTRKVPPVTPPEAHPRRLIGRQGDPEIAGSPMIHLQLKSQCWSDDCACASDDGVEVETKQRDFGEEQKRKFGFGEEGQK